MSEELLSFEAFDTLWFREGRPFDQMDDGLAEARAVFPPSPSVLAGALAGLIHPMQRGDQPDPRLLRIAGTDPNATDQITFAGPFLADEDRLVYVPVPATLLGRKRKRRESEHAFLADEKNAKNLGLVLPHEGLALGGPVALHLREDNSSSETFEPLMNSGAWIRLSDVALHMADMTAFHKAVGKKREPEKLKDLQRDPIIREQRLGIGIDVASRTAANGQLYAAQHLRPKGDCRALQLAAFISDPRGDAVASLRDQTAALGGKGRFARLSLSTSTLADPFKQVPESHRQEWHLKQSRTYFRFTALTPVPLGSAKTLGLPLPEGGGMLEDLKTVAAIMPRLPAPIGIWNSTAKDRPARVIQAHPAGTTWFATAILPQGLTQDKVVEAVLELRFVPDGMEDLGAMGFGVMAVGEWPTYPEARARMERGQKR